MGAFFNCPRYGASLSYKILDPEGSGRHCLRSPQIPCLLHTVWKEVWESGMGHEESYPSAVLGKVADVSPSDLKAKKPAKT